MKCSIRVVYKKVKGFEIVGTFPAHGGPQITKGRNFLSFFNLNFESPRALSGISLFRIEPKNLF